MIVVVLYAVAAVAALAALTLWRSRKVPRVASVTGGAALLSAMLALFLSTQSSAGSASVTGPPRTPAERVALLDNSLRAIEDGDRDAPRDRWDPDYVVNQTGNNPDSIVKWVKENTAWIPYRGVLRGPTGVLMDRQGNSLDRALLLATLLEKAGHTVRLAHSELPREKALEILSQLISARAVPRYEAAEADAGPSPTLETIAQQYRINPPEIEQTLSKQAADVEQMFVELRNRVVSQTERLLREAEPPTQTTDWTMRFEKAIGAVRDHWWVQRDDGGTWSDLDVLQIEATNPDVTVATAEIPADLHHELVVRVVAEQWAAGALKEAPVLEFTLRPVELSGQPIALQFWPAAWPKELHPDPNSQFGFRHQALEQTKWSAALIVGNDLVTQGVFAVDGEPQASGANPYGGLGAGIVGVIAQAQPQSTAELTAAWIEYEIRTPGHPTRTIRRAVFDLFGPAARSAGSTSHLAMDEGKRLTRSLALMMRTDILPVTSRVAPEFVTHLAAHSLLANRELMRSVVGNLSSPADIDRDSVLAKAAPTVTPLYSLAFARLEWSRFSDAIYVDRIGLLTRHRHAGPIGDRIAMRGAVEIVARDIGVSLVERDAFSIRLEQGVLDTNAESLWWLGEGLNNTAEAYNSSADWITLGSAQSGDVDRLSLPADARVRIKQDLASGLLVVAPKKPVRRGNDSFAGWWGINPTTGATFGTTGNGWAQCGTEYSTHLVVIGQFARGFAFEYALCHELAQAVNAFRLIASELRARGLFFYNGVIPVADPKDVAGAALGGCVIGAIFAGMLSTMPFFLVSNPERWAEFGIAGRTLKTINPYRMPTGTVVLRVPPRPVPKTLKVPQLPPGAGTALKGNPVSTGRYPRPGPGGTLAAGRAPAPKTGTSPQAPTGANPIAKGNPAGPAPNVRPGPKGTAPEATAPPPRAPKRLDLKTAEANYARALEGEAQLEHEARVAFDRMQDYRDRYPPEGWRGYKYQHPEYDPQVDNRNGDLLFQKIREKHAYMDAKVAPAEEAVLDARMRARGQAGKGGFPPPNPALRKAAPPPSPAPASNAKLAVGSSGAASSFYPFSGFPPIKPPE